MFCCYIFYGDFMKKFLILFLSTLVLGGGIAYFIFNKVVVEDVNEDVFLTAKAFQVGVFSNYDNALRVADRNNGIVVSDDDVFRVYVAVLYNRKAIEKLSSYYKSIGLNYYLRDVVVTDEFVGVIESSESMLLESSADVFSVINMNVLNKFKEFL